MTSFWLSGRLFRSAFFVFHNILKPSCILPSVELTLTRFQFTEESTIGQLEIDGKFECFTLEDKVRDIKIKGKTAIPAGKYKVDITWSNRFKRYLPLLLKVPNFEGIRIHSGNTDEDTEGCILVGRTHRENFIGESKLAFGLLFPRLMAAKQKKEPITIEIKERKSDGTEPQILA